MVQLPARSAIRTILLVAIVATLCVALAAAIINLSAFARVEKLTQPELPVVLVADAGASWPMFRGRQSLLGTAQGTLSDSLTPVWKFKTGGPISSSPAIDDGLVFIGSDDGNIYAIDLKNGRMAWSYKTGDAVEAAPCVVNGLVFAGSVDTFLYALDAKAGALKWKYKTDGRILGAANWTLSPDEQTTWILVGSYDSRLHCVDAANGNPVWTYETGSYINGSPAVSNGKAVFGGCDAMIHVVSLADGTKAAEIDTGSFIAASAALAKGKVFVGNYDNTFISADINTLQILWRYTLTDSPFFSSPAVTEKLVVFGGRDNRVHCVSRDNGKRVWTFKTLGEVDSSPVICGDKVVVGSEDGWLYMLNLADGKKVWSYEIGQPVTSSPAIAEGIVIVGSDDGYLYAFAAKR